MPDRGKTAEEYFGQGYNCAQAVVLAYADKMGIDSEQAVRIASPFGGGMGRMREVCGAVSGMFMVLGAVEGYCDPKAKEEKKELYTKTQQMAEAFKKENGSIVCRELLGLDGAQPPAADERTFQYYKKRPCGELVRCAAEIVEQYVSGKE